MRIVPRYPNLAKSAFNDLIVVLLITIVGMSCTFLQSSATTSDQLTIISLADDVMTNRTFNAQLWLYPRAPYFFPDFSLTLVLKTLIRGDVNVAWLMQCYQLLVTSTLACVVLRRLGWPGDPRSAIRIYGAMIVLAFVSCNISSIGETFIYPFLSFSHAGALVLALIGGLMFAEGVYVDRRSLLSIVACTLLTILGMASDKTFIVIFSMPVVVVASIELFLTRRSALVPIAIVQAVAIGPMLALDRYLPFQVMPAFDGFAVLPHLRNIALSFSGLPPVFATFVIISLINVLAFVFQVGREIRRSRALDGRQRLRLFLAVSSTTNILFCVALWAEPDPGYARYAVVIQFVAPVLLTRSASAWLERVVTSRPASAALTVAAVLLAIVIPSWRSPFAMIKQQNAIASRLHHCVATNDLKSGLAQYWLARKLSSSTDWSVQIDQLEPAYPQAFFWGSDLQWYFRRMDGVSSADHNFVIVDGFGQQALEAKLGIPVRYVTCEGWEIAVYDEHKLDRRITAQLERNPAVVRAEASLPGAVQHAIGENRHRFDLADLSLKIGQRTQDSVEVNPSSGSGYFLYGPYVTLSAGSYQAVFEFRCEGALGGTSFDVSADAGKRTLETWSFAAHPDICDGKPRSATMAFILSDMTALIETHAVYGGSGHLTVTSLLMTRVDSSPRGSAQGK